MGRARGWWAATEPPWGSRARGGTSSESAASDHGMGVLRVSSSVSVSVSLSPSFSLSRCGETEASDQGMRPSRSPSRDRAASPSLSPSLSAHQQAEQHPGSGRGGRQLQPLLRVDHTVALTRLGKGDVAALQGTLQRYRGA